MEGTSNNTSQTLMEVLENFRSSHPFKVLDVDGVKWQYLIGGEGIETILLLVGGFRYGEFMFRHIIELESKYRVISPTYAPVETADKIIDGIAAILRHEEVERVHVVGQSFGGLVAQFLARDYPDLVGSIILSNTTAPSDEIDENVKINRIKQLKRSVRMFKLLPYRLWLFLLAQKLPKLFDTTEEEKEFFMAYVREVFQYHQTKAELMALDKVMLDMAENYVLRKSDLEGWEGHILLIGSENDPAFHPAEWDAMKRLYPQARVYTFPGKDHGPILTRRKEYLEVVRNFVSDITIS